ncbi:uncharacterized protein [Narcine bancroftii]|uniref:uncharacterized protein n=1 Tax=Narcine bancroftii TaxID=1343680 RepID=UPI0038314CFA
MESGDDEHACASVDRDDEEPLYWNCGGMQGIPQKYDRVGKKRPRALPAHGFAGTSAADPKPGPIRKGPLQVQNSKPLQSQEKQTPLPSLPQQELPVPQGPPLLHLRDQRLRLSHMLRPNSLEFDPRNPGAGTHFGHWQRCFLNYMEGAEASDKELLMLLLVQLGDHPYSLIQDARSYQWTMSILQRDYSKGHSELHSRYRLMTRSQQVGESAIDFILSLKDLARGCNFKAVSAQEYAEDIIRDRIVAGIRSTEMRHRLLEKGMVGQDEAETIAEALENTRKELEEYSQDPGAGTNIKLLDSLAPR